jgi:DNA-binding NarL/FixJ family response regulator
VVCPIASEEFVCHQGSVRTLNKPIQVLIVDDHALVREGLRSVIERQDDMQVCGEADDAAGALRIVAEEPPDVAVVDLTLRSGSGLELIADLRARRDTLRIVVSSMHDETLFAERALAAGAMGYVHKQEGSQRVVEAIRRVAQGDVFLSDAMAQHLLSRVTTSNNSPQTPIESLTNRELEVFELIGHGHSARQIAERLHLSPKTIDRYRENIKHKLRLASASEVLRHATHWVLQLGGKSGDGAPAEQPAHKPG